MQKDIDSWLDCILLNLKQIQESPSDFDLLLPVFKATIDTTPTTIEDIIESNNTLTKIVKYSLEMRDLFDLKDIIQFDTILNTFMSKLKFINKKYPTFYTFTDAFNHFMKDRFSKIL
jgi:hypothetical protein